MAADRSVIATDKAPKAIGPYSQAIKYGDMLFVSGMIPIDPVTGAVSTGDITAQAKLVMDNVKATVEAAGFTMADVLKSDCYLADLKDFGEFNKVYGTYFTANPPARVTVRAAGLPRGVLLEVAVIVGKGASRTVIATDKAPKAIGPYSQAIKYGDMLFASGMIPIDPATGTVSTGDITAQAKLVMDNIKATVEAAGFTMADVLKSDCFLADLKDFGDFNKLYATYFTDKAPARVTVRAAGLPRGVLLEVAVIVGK